MGIRLKNLFVDPGSKGLREKVVTLEIPGGGGTAIYGLYRYVPL